MKIIACDDFKPGVTLDDLRPHLREEVGRLASLPSARRRRSEGPPVSRQAAITPLRCQWWLRNAREFAFATIRRIRHSTT